MSSCAQAAPLSIMLAASATPVSHSLFMLFSSDMRAADLHGRPCPTNLPVGILSGFPRKSPGIRAGPALFFGTGCACPPGQRACALEQPVILRRHLGSPRHPPRECADEDEVKR